MFFCNALLLKQPKLKIENKTIAHNLMEFFINQFLVNLPILAFPLAFTPLKI